MLVCASRKRTCKRCGLPVAAVQFKQMRPVRIELTTLGLWDPRATNCAIAALKISQLLDFMMKRVEARTYQARHLAFSLARNYKTRRSSCLHSQVREQVFITLLYLTLGTSQQDGLDFMCANNCRPSHASHQEQHLYNTYMSHVFKISDWLFGLVAWFSLRVREVLGSIPRTALDQSQCQLNLITALRHIGTSTWISYALWSTTGKHLNNYVCPVKVLLGNTWTTTTQRAVLGIEPRTSRTRSENHTTRPNSQWVWAHGNQNKSLSAMTHHYDREWLKIAFNWIFAGCILRQTVELSVNPILWGACICQA